MNHQRQRNEKIALKRSDAKKSLVENVKLEENKLPLNIDVVNHYYYSRRFYSDSKAGFLNKMPNFNDLRNEVINDAINI